MKRGNAVRRGLTLAETMVAMALLAIWSVPIIFTSQKALQSSLQTEELQASYEHAQALAERCMTLAVEANNWELFNQDTDGDGDIENDTAVYHWAYQFDYTRGDGSVPPDDFELEAYDNPRQIRPHDKDDNVKYLEIEKAFVTHIDIDPITNSDGSPTGLSKATISVFQASSGDTPQPDATLPRGGLLVTMTVVVGQVAES